MLKFVDGYLPRLKIIIILFLFKHLIFIIKFLDLNHKSIILHNINKFIRQIINF